MILGGYSSGGDLAYRTGFRHSTTFAGLLIENSSPFRDTESTPAESLAAATTKLPIVHLAHTGDTTYPIAGVREEVGEVEAAGFPIELIERPGTHYDSHTDGDLVEYLLSAHRRGLAEVRTGGTLPSRRRPWQAVAAAERAGLWGVPDPWRYRDAGRTRVPRESHETRISSRRAWEVHASVRVGQQSIQRCTDLVPYRGPEVVQRVFGP